MSQEKAYLGMCKDAFNNDREPKKSQSVKENETLGVNKFITFVLPESVATSSNLPSVMRCSFEEGQTVMDVGVNHGVPMEAACGGQCACTTCHVILKESNMNMFPEPKLYEDDMLDLALNAVDTSRLGCQLVLNKTHCGLEFRLPDGTWNQYRQATLSQRNSPGL